MADSSGSPGPLRGFLEDGDARPVVGARLTVEGGDEHATSGPDGGFGLPLPVGGGPATLRVHDRGREYRVVVAREGGERVRVVLVPPDGVPLRVLTPGSAPVPRHFGWQALARTPAGLVPGPSGEATAPRFAVRGLAPGRHVLVVWAGPFLPIVHEGVEVDGSMSLPLVTLELSRRGASVAGRVLNALGQPRPGARVQARLAGGGIALPERRTTCDCDAGGRWRVEGLPPGRYTLVVSVEDGAAPSETTTSLLEREERAMDLVI